MFSKLRETLIAFTSVGDTVWTINGFSGKVTRHNLFTKSTYVQLDDHYECSISWFLKDIFYTFDDTDNQYRFKMNDVVTITSISDVLDGMEGVVVGEFGQIYGLSGLDSANILVMPDDTSSGCNNVVAVSAKRLVHGIRSTS